MIYAKNVAQVRVLRFSGKYAFQVHHFVYDDDAVSVRF